MKRLRTVLAAAIAGAGLLASSAAMGQSAPSNWYAGIGFGSAKVKDFCDTGGIPGLTVNSCDDKATGWKILGGYQLNKNLAFEAAYTTGSDFEASLTYMGTPVSLSAKANFLEGTVVGMLPLGERFALLGKIGLNFWNLKVSDSVFGSESDSGLGLTYGFGAQFDFTPKFGVRAEWQMYPSIGNEDTTGQDDVDVLSASVYFRF